MIENSSSSRRPRTEREALAGRGRVLVEAFGHSSAVSALVAVLMKMVSGGRDRCAPSGRSGTRRTWFRAPPPAGLRLRGRRPSY